MAAADTAALIASLELKDQFTPGVGKALTSLGKLEGGFNRIGGLAKQGVQTAAANVARIGVIGAGFVAANVFAGIRSLEELERANQQTAAVIESTGGKAGVTAKQVQDLASSLEDLTTVDDKVVQSGENMLLTFTNIGKDVFPDATKAMVNMGVAMAGGDASAVDLQATAIQLGKALNDPIKGVTALSKVGVSFTEQQKEQIKAMVEAGDVAGAQTIILKELETEFGKAGEAAGTGFGADMRRFQDAIEGAQQALAVGFLPIIQEVTRWLNEKLRDPKVIQAIKDFGQKGAGLLSSAFEAAKSIPWDTIANAFSLMGQGAQAAWNIFNGMPDWLKTAVLTGWGLNKLTGGALGGIVSELGKGLIKGVLGMTAAVVNINAATVNGAGSIPGAAGKGAGGIAGGVVAGGLLAGTIFLAVDQLGRLPTYIQGAQETLNAKTLAEWKAGWEHLWQGSTVLTAMQPLRDWFEKQFPQIFGGTTPFPGGPKATDTLRGPTVVEPGPGFNDYMRNQTQQTEAQKQELQRFHQQAANQLGQMTGDITSLPSRISSFIERWASAKSDALAAGFKAGTAAMKREIASKLGITIGTLKALRESFRSSLASELGITTGELRHLNRTFNFNEEKIAAKLGISVEQLRALKEEARKTAANTTKIKNKDWTPTITVPVSVKSTFSVSGRAVAQATEKFWSINRPRVT